MTDAVQRCLQPFVACCLLTLAVAMLLGVRHHLGAHLNLKWVAVKSVARVHWLDAAAGTAIPLAEERLFGAPLRSLLTLGDDVPALEPEAYSRYYSDVPRETEHALAAHYVAFGRHEHRVSQRLRVVATYEAAAGLDSNIVFGGLCNQIYSHIGMLSVALQMGAEVVLPDAVHRGGRGFADSFFNGAVVPVRAPLDTLFDVDHLVAWGKAVGAVIHSGAPELNGSVTVSVTGESICCLNTMDYLVGTIRDAVLDAVKEFLLANPDRDAREPLPVVELKLLAPKLMMALRTDTSHVELIEEVARNLRPAPRVRSAADAIVAIMTADGATFNGIHLRMEADAGFQNWAGGDEIFLGMYMFHLEAGNCTAEMPLYVASGLLTYMNASDFMAQYGTKFVERGVCASVFVKEQLLADSKREGMLSEALALVDLLVLVRARFYTGFAISSFSWVVQEYRCLEGLLPRVSQLVRIANNPVAGAFEGAGHLTNHSVTCPDTGPGGGDGADTTRTGGRSQMHDVAAAMA